MQTVFFTGQLTIQTISTLHQQYQGQLLSWQEQGGVLFDLTEIEQVDSSGLQWLLMLKQHLHKQAASLHLKTNAVIELAAKRIGMQESLFG